MRAFRKKMGAFLQDEDGTYRIEYAALGAIIVLAILAVVAVFLKKGK